MKKLLKIAFYIFSTVFLLYILIPNQQFPQPSDKSTQSSEPADVESNLRRGYYNNETRSEVLSYYISKFNEISVFNHKFKLFSITLNYPPEEAQTLIRDQTRSTYLMEIVHPMRESLFINGFEPQRDNDMIIVDNKTYKQKIIIKMVNSELLQRLLIGMSALFSIYILGKSWGKLIDEFKTN